MNCDLVFEILTRGPFPAGQPTDATVELHLLSCYECRQLAEALRPATSLFHEALGDDRAVADLPGYHGDLPVMTARPSAVAAAVEAAIQQIAQETSEQQSLGPLEVVVRKPQGWAKPPLISLPVSLAVLSLCVVAALFVGYGLGDAHPSVSQQFTSNPIPVTDASWQVTMAGLPISCQPNSPGESLLGSAHGSTKAFLSQCCQCHMQPGSQATSAMLVNHSVGLCLACHTN